jgi:hypothetical protein
MLSVESSPIMLSVVMLSIFMLSDAIKLTMLSVDIHNVVMLSAMLKECSN